MKKQKLPKRRNVYAASLASAQFKHRVVQVKIRKIIKRDDKSLMMEDVCLTLET